MGILLSRFSRETYYANYEKAFAKLEQEKEMVTQRSERREANKNKAGRSLVFVGAGTTTLAAIYASWVFRMEPEESITLQGRAFRLSLFLLIPILMTIIYRFVLASFSVLSKWDAKKLQRIEKTTEEMLRDLKDCNRYSKIHELLQKYDPEEQKKMKMLAMLERGPPASGTSERRMEKAASMGKSLITTAGRVFDTLANEIIGDQPELLSEIEKLRKIIHSLEEKNAELQQRLSIAIQDSPLEDEEHVEDDQSYHSEGWDVQ